MRSLFGKIFVSFIFITLLASITTAMISYWAQIGPYGELRKRLQYQQYQVLVHTLSVIGLAAEKILETGDVTDVLSYLREVEKIDDNRVFLLKEDNSTFSGRILPTGVDDLAAAVRRSDGLQHNISETDITVALPLPGVGGHGVVIAGIMDRTFWLPTFSKDNKEKQFFSHGPFHLPLGLPLLVMVCIAASGCYLLARSLTAPILHLRAAVQKMAKGDFSARVTLPHRKGDEIADLGSDFNTMAQRIESLLQSQKRLLRDISHELRSPLTRMNVSLELARQRAGEAGPYLLRIEKESDRLNELIGQLLTLTRLEGDVNNAPKEPVEFSGLVRDIVHDAEFEAVNLNKKIVVCNLDTVTVLGSREMLSRAVENVVRNGLRYTAVGSTVEVEVSKGKDQVEVIIKDQGPGVPEEYLDQIFKPFFRVAESRDRDSGGTGIGLAIARQAVLMHGGSIEAKNGPTGGLVVTLRLPLL